MLFDCLPGREPATISVEEQIFAAGIRGNLVAMFDDVDPDLRALLVASAVDGLFSKEAGHLLVIPRGTVKTRLERAREHMREQLT